jgi:hypothetical protein
MTHVFVVEEAERKTTSTGKNYARAKVTGIGWASIWDANDGNLVLSNSPGTFKGELIEKDGFKNLQGLSIAADGEAPTTPKSSDDMSKEDWRQKDSEDWLRRLYISHLGNLVALSAPEIGTLVYDKYRAQARTWATQDLLWIRGGGTDVPF